MFFDEWEDIIIIETQENRGQKTIQPELDRETAGCMDRETAKKTNFTPYNQRTRKHPLSNNTLDTSPALIKLEHHEKIRACTKNQINPQIYKYRTVRAGSMV